MSEDEIKTIVLEVLGSIAPEVDAASIDPNASFRDQLDIDSMDFLNFIIALHERLKVEIPETDYPRLSSLAGCVAYLRSKQAA